MNLLRVFLAWILLAALPLQGYAAAAMLYCGPGGAHQSVAQRSMTHEPLEVHGAKGSHESNGHADARHHEHPAAQHAAGHAHVSQGPDVSHASHVSHLSQAGGESAHLSPDTLAGLDHPCSVCAACSHSVALAQTPHVVAGPAVPHPSGAEAFGTFPTRPAPVPDKPPRA